MGMKAPSVEVLRVRAFKVNNSISLHPKEPVSTKSPKLTSSLLEGWLPLEASIPLNHSLTAAAKGFL